ncbi:MAG TPA: ABC transporter ATP-binding protein [Gemmatimonadaceae bacterium]|nr:ABC transporter ATP-binding protein [Gemmatimonadaceae bacterium]
MISLRAVSKSYPSLIGRRVPAVDGVSLDVNAGEVVGIAGPNGAGKSTIIAMLLGFLRPTSGEVTVGGMAPRAYVERHGVAYLPELMSLVKSWRVDHALRRLAVLAGVPASRVSQEVARVVAHLEIGEHVKKRIKALSKGNFQRVGLAQALLCEHDVVVFDEPTHGLDPVWTQRFRGLVDALRAPGRSMLVASHNLDELERVCDRVAILDRGRLQRVVTVRGPAAGDGAVPARAYRLRVAGDAQAALAAFPGAVVAGEHEIDVPPTDVAGLNAGLAQLIAGGVQVTALAPRESALEAAFHAAVGAGGRGRAD